MELDRGEIKSIGGRYQIASEVFISRVFAEGDLPRVIDECGLRLVSREVPTKQKLDSYLCCMSDRTLPIEINIRKLAGFKFYYV